MNNYLQSLSSFWHPVLPLADLSDYRPVGIKLLDSQVVLAQGGYTPQGSPIPVSGKVYALDDLCRHWGAALSDGELRGVGNRLCVMCPYHGWTYDLETGQCVDIPRKLKQVAIPKDARVQTLPVQVHDGMIWVSLTQDPVFPHISDYYSPFPVPREDVHIGPWRTYYWKASLTRTIMAGLDNTHFPWVHQGLLGDRDEPDPPDHEVWRDHDGLLFTRYTVEQDNPTVAEREVTYTTCVAMPGYGVAHKVSGNSHYFIWIAVSPTNAEHCTVFMRIGRDFDLDRPDKEFEEFEDILRSQDQRVVEGQRPWLLPPLSARLSLPLREADKPLIEYQLWCEELGIVVN